MSHFLAPTLQVPNFIAYDIEEAPSGYTQLPVAVVECYMRRLAMGTEGKTPTQVVQAEDLRLVARLARGLALRPNVVLAYTGHDTLADVKMNLEVACCTAPACADKEDMQHQLEALGTGMPLWEVIENKR